MELIEVETTSRYKLLVASPIHQKDTILKEFLRSLDSVETDDLSVDFYFIDDNDDENSSKLLSSFAKGKNNVICIKSYNSNKYDCTEITHNWNEELIWKVANMKNTIIEYSKSNSYDYLFLIDSDLIINARTLKHLLSLRKDIVSEIFWTKWKPDLNELPQVWLYDHYTQYNLNRGEKLAQDEMFKRQQVFLQQLRKPGVYEVGGLGACTLISKKALEGGNNFSLIKNVTFWGEDRHFCIRACALGYQLFVDTQYPAYHIYRESDLKGVSKYIKENNENENIVQVKQIVKDGFEALGSYDYRIGYRKEWLPYFASEVIREIMDNISHQIIKYCEDKLVITAMVLNCNVINMNDDSNRATVSFTLVNNGQERGIEFIEKSQCEAIVVKQQNGSWVIQSFEVLQQ